MKFKKSKYILFFFCIFLNCNLYIKEYSDESILNLPEKYTKNYSFYVNGDEYKDNVPYSGSCKCDINDSSIESNLKIIDKKTDEIIFKENVPTEKWITIEKVGLRFRVAAISTTAYSANLIIVYREIEKTQNVNYDKNMFLYIIVCLCYPCIFFFLVAYDFPLHIYDNIINIVFIFFLIFFIISFICLSFIIFYSPYSLYYTFAIHVPFSFLILFFIGILSERHNRKIEKNKIKKVLINKILEEENWYK